jgi:hypothetical protein
MFCRDCKWCKPNYYENRCSHPFVNSHSPAALANNEYVKCSDERKKWFFGACGIKGKLFELNIGQIK